MPEFTGMYKTEIDPNEILGQVLKENKGLSKIYNQDNTRVIFASPERTKAMQSTGINGGLEYWPANETGVSGYGHPMPGKTAIEIHSEDLKNDPIQLKKAIYGDLASHGSSQIPEYQKLREEFINNYLPDTLKFEESMGRKGVWGKEGEHPYSRHDAYIRAKLVDPDTKGYTGWSDKIYSPKQLELIEKMKYIIKQGVPLGEGMNIK